jgi:hypothetical protein
MNAALQRAKRGELTAIELTRIADQLRSGDTRSDLYPLILAVGYAQARGLEAVVAGYLNCESDPMLSRAALVVLCSQWGFYEKYVADVEQLCEGKSWDRDEDVRLQAISIAGEAMRSGYGRPSLAKRLLSIARNPDERRLIRTAAFSALERAAGAEWSQLEPASEILDLDTEASRSALSRLEEALASSE